MITAIGTVGLVVSDQDAAVRFFVDVLGFEKRADAPMGPNQRWIELAPPGGATAIVPVTPDFMQGMDGRLGTFSMLTLRCADIDATCAALKARGVAFEQEPRAAHWGRHAIFKDPDGNSFVLVEPAGEPAD